MSSGEAEGESGEELTTTQRVYRTVTPSYLGRHDAEMDVIGWSYFLGLLILLVPLLPFILILWVGNKLLKLLTRQQSRR
jgi:hypothetical protein